MLIFEFGLVFVLQTTSRRAHKYIDWVRVMGCISANAATEKGGMQTTRRGKSYIGRNPKIK